MKTNVHLIRVKLVSNGFTPDSVRFGYVATVIPSIKLPKDVFP